MNGTITHSAAKPAPKLAKKIAINHVGLTLGKLAVAL
jgi:hypothetical protein